MVEPQNFLNMSSKCSELKRHEYVVDHASGYPSFVSVITDMQLLFTFGTICQILRGVARYLITFVIF